MKKSIIKFLFLSGFFILLSQTAFSQARIVFRIDLKQQMKDSVFIPSMHSAVVTGNQWPFNNLRNFALKDKEPVDSIYVAEVNFPASVMGETLKYNFIIKREMGDIEENRPRLLPLKSTPRRILDIAYLNNFAW